MIPLQLCTNFLLAFPLPLTVISDFLLDRWISETNENMFIRLLQGCSGMAAFFGVVAAWQRLLGV